MQTGIIDTHVHIWDLKKAEYEWLKNNTSILNRSYEIAELESSRITAGITGGVLIQAANNFEDTNYMLETAAATEWIKGVVGWVPLMDPEFTATALQQYMANPYFKGVRHLIHDEPNPRWLLQPSVLQSLSILAAFDVPYDVVGVETEHLRTALEVAAKVPDLRMIFDHANQPPFGEPLGEWGDLMKQSAQHRNFYVKLSGFGTGKDIQPYVAYLLEQFGDDRCCCGGDWPVSLLGGSYLATWDQYKTVLSALLEEQPLHKVLHSNAISFYHL
jgi:L-fuconolactonase